MKKKLLALALVLILAMTSAFASYFQFGPSASLPLPLDFENPETIGEPFKHFENYKFGVDLRATIPFNKVIGLGVGVPAFIGLSKEVIAFNTTPTLDLVLAPKSFASIEVGLGYDIIFSYDGVTFSNSFDPNSKRPAWYHLGVDLDLSLFGLNLSYYVPGTTIEDWNPQFNNGRVVCSFYLLNF